MEIWSLIFIFALITLLKSSKLFVESCEKLVKGLGWSSFFVGATVLAIGTSLPELTTSLWASFQNITPLVSSAVVGSNIANILFILGVGAVMVKQIEINRDTLHSQIGLLLGSTFMLIVTLYDGRVEWYEGVLLMAVYIIYTIYNANEHKAGRLEALKDWFTKEEVSTKLILTLIGSTAALGFSSYFVIEAVEQIASKTGLLPGLLGASVLALGTSLPELVTATMALKKGNRDLALGGIIGSNIFNSSLVMGLPTLFGPLIVGNETLTLGIPFLLMSTLLLVFALTQRKLFSYEGAVYLMLYAVFSFQLFTSY